MAHGVEVPRHCDDTHPPENWVEGTTAHGLNQIYPAFSLYNPTQNTVSVSHTYKDPLAWTWVLDKSESACYINGDVLETWTYENSGGIVK